MAFLALGVLALSLQAPDEASGTTIYRWTDSTGQEHFVNDPSFLPPGVNAKLQQVDLTHAPETSVPSAQPVDQGACQSGQGRAQGACQGSAEVTHASSAVKPVEWRNTWIWASVIAGILLLIILITFAVVPSRYQRVSHSLYVARYISVLLLVATVIAASYELRNDPAMRRYSPWAAVERFQNARLEAFRHFATQEKAPAPAGPAEGHAR
jgi:hypothetical protein